MAIIGLKKAVNHRQAIALPISQAGTHKATGAAISARLTIFDHMGVDRCRLDHVGIIHIIHLRHAAAWMARRQIAPEQLILLVGSPRLTC